MLMKSDDDDGYCSRSSIDSPIQINKLDGIHFSDNCPIQTEVIEETASTETNLSNFSSLIPHVVQNYQNYEQNEVFSIINKQNDNLLTTKSNLTNKNFYHSNKIYNSILDVNYKINQSVLKPELNLNSLKNNINSNKLIVSVSSSSIIHSTCASNLSTNFMSSRTSNSVKLQSVILPSNRNIKKPGKMNISLYNEVSSNGSNCVNKFPSRGGRIQNIKNNTPLFNSVHPVVDHDYCEFSTFNAEIQSGILLLSTETCLRTDKLNSRKLKTSKLLNNNVKTSAQNKKLENDKELSDSFIVPLGRPRHIKVTKAKKESNIEKLANKLQPNVHNEFVYYATPAPSLNKRKSHFADKQDEQVDISKLITQQQAPKTSFVSREDWSKTNLDMNESDIADLILDMMPKLMEYHDILKIKSTTLPVKISHRNIDVSGNLENIEFNFIADEISDIFNLLNEGELKTLENSFTLDKTDFEDVFKSNSNQNLSQTKMPLSLSSSNFNTGKSDKNFSVKMILPIESMHRSHTSSSSISSEASPPVLIIVKLFWNELPGLKIDHHEYVRLIDIHKQILPAKDTGILKRRCQIMGFEFKECTDMGRDFLIRYAAAAQSKSKVIVSKKTATSLIEFYAGDRLRENYLKLRREKALNTFQSRQNMRRSSGNTTKDENGVKRSARLHDKRLLGFNFKMTSCASRMYRSKHILKENVARKLVSWDKISQRTISTRRFSSSMEMGNSLPDCEEVKREDQTENEFATELIQQTYIVEPSVFNPLKISFKIPNPSKEYNKLVEDEKTLTPDNSDDALNIKMQIVSPLNICATKIEADDVSLVKKKKVPTATLR